LSRLRNNREEFKHLFKIHRVNRNKKIIGYKNCKGLLENLKANLKKWNNRKIE
jgi:hypothetical protein